MPICILNIIIRDCYKSCTCLFIMKFTAILFFCITILFSGCLYAQSQQQNEALREDIKKNTQLFQHNIDSAFLQIDGLLERAIVQKDKKSELLLLDRKCRYYYSKNDVNSLALNAEKLKEKAVSYVDYQMQCMAHIYLAETFSLNKLYDKAIVELEKGYKIIEKSDVEDPKIFFTKSNLLNSMANVYNDKGEPEKAAEKIKISIKNYKTLKDQKDINRYQHLNYANLSAIYLSFNHDSAAYYAQKSMDISPDSIGDDKAMITNYAVLGQVAMTKKEYKTALMYFLKACETGEKSGQILNLENIYENLVTVYTQLEDEQNIRKYEQKLKEYRLSVMESKYNSLQEVVKKETEQKTASNTIYLYLLIPSGLLILVGILVLLKNKKNRQDTETKNDAILIYPSLIEMIKNDDSGFMYAFEKVHSDFSDKLLAIDSSLTKSEIEFCALLKLNLSTKKIAQLKFIEIRTVQNKKYKIRKKLHIPANTDIYIWFSGL